MKITGIEIDGEMYDLEPSKGFNNEEGYCSGCHFNNGDMLCRIVCKVCDDINNTVSILVKRGGSKCSGKA